MGYHLTQPITLSLQPNVPVTYGVETFRKTVASCRYNLAITIEQLVQQ